MYFPLHMSSSSRVISKHGVSPSKITVTTELTASKVGQELKDVAIKQSFDTEATDSKRDKITSHDEIVLHISPQQQAIVCESSSNRKSVSLMNLLFGKFLCCF